MHWHKFHLITVQPCQQKRHKLKIEKENIHLALRSLEFCLPLVQHSGVPVVFLSCNSSTASFFLFFFKIHSTYSTTILRCNHMARYCGFGSFGGLLGLRGSLRFEFRFLHGSAVRVRSFEEAQLQEEKKPFQKCRKHKWEQTKSH